MTTDSQEEQLTLVDSKNKVIGPIARGLAHSSKNVYYRTIYVLVKNRNGEILLQKRSATKDLYPNCWDLSVGGHVGYGDSYEETAVREMEEELGIAIEENELKYLGEVLVTLPSSHEYFHVFEYGLKDDDRIAAATEEVAETQWMTVEAIKESMKTGSLTWYPRPEQVITKLY